MSITDTGTVNSVEPAGPPLGIKELTAVLIKHYGIHEGLYDLFMEYQFAFGNFGPTPEQMAPSAVVGLTKLSVTRVAKAGPVTVDAKDVNPMPERSRTKRSSKEKESD